MVPDVITYSALTSASQIGSGPEHAGELLKAMQRQCVVPKVIMYSAFISTCTKRK